MLSSICNQKNYKKKSKTDYIKDKINIKALILIRKVGKGGKNWIDFANYCGMTPKICPFLVVYCGKKTKGLLLLFSE